MILGKGTNGWTCIEISEDGEFSPQSPLALHPPSPKGATPVRLILFQDINWSLFFCVVPLQPEGAEQKLAHKEEA